MTKGVGHTEFRDTTEIERTQKDWNVSSLGDIALDIYRYPTYFNISYEDKGVPEVRGELVKENGELEEDLGKYRFISEKTSRKFQRTILKEGDFVLSVRGTMGKVAIVPQMLIGANITANLIRISLDRSKCFPPFFKQYFLSDGFKRKLDEFSSQTTIKTIQAPRLKSIEVPIPSFTEQQRIAEILQTIDNIIDETKDLIEKHKKIKQGLMQDLLEQGTRKDRQKKCVINDRQYLVPESWVIKDVGRTSTLKGRIGWQGLTTAEYLKNGEYFLVTGTDFKEDRIEWDTCFFVSEKRYLQDRNIQVKEGDVLITKDGTIGKIAYIDRLPKPATLNSGIFVVRPQNRAYLPSYLYFILSSAIFNDFIENLKAGSTIAHLYQKDFVNFEFSVPETEEEQRRISAIFFKATEKIQSEQSYLEKLYKIKMGLMQDLLTGKVRVAA